MAARWIGILAWVATAIVVAACLGGVWQDWSGSVAGPFGGVDPHLQLGLMEWNARHLGDSHHWADLPIFHPVPGAVGFMDTMRGQTWLVLPIRWMFHPTATSLYNSAFLFSLLLSAVAMALFWRASGGRWESAGVAALALIATPYTISQVGHLNQLPPPFVLFSLAALVSALRRQNQKKSYAAFWWLLGGCLVMQGAWGWQGFAYAILAVAVFTVTWLVFWMRLREPTFALMKPVLFRAALPAVLAAVGIVLLAQPQLKVGERYDEFTRTNEEVRTGSADLQHIFYRGVYVAGFDDLNGAAADSPDRWLDRQAMSPSWFAVLLAAIGWWYRGYLTSDQRRIGRALFILGLLGVVLAFGDSVGIPFTDRRLPLPFSFLREIAPPFKAFRTVWRFSWLATLGIAWWSAVGAEQLLKRYPNRRWSAAVVGAALVLVTITAWPAGIPAIQVGFPLQSVPSREVPGPVLSLPAPLHEFQEDRTEALWLLRALEIGQPVTGGATGWVPPEVTDLRRRLHECESGRADAQELLREMAAAGVMIAEIAVRPEDNERVEFWAHALEVHGAVPFDPVPRAGYRMYKLRVLPETVTGQ